MRVAITGAEGLIGRNIRPFLDDYFDVIAFSREEWDIRDRGRGEELLSTFKPEVLVNLAAFTDVDGCEEERELAYSTNVQGPRVLAELCLGFGTKLVHFSTDYVFDGRKGAPYREDDPPNPLSFYGLTKLEGEREVLSRLKDPLVIRTQWVYGKGREDFPKRIIALSREGEVSVVSDQIGSPTYAKDIGPALAALLEKGLSGIFHVANSGACSWFDFAKEIVEYLGIACRLKPISVSELKRKARRPLYSVLDTERLRLEAGFAMRHWKEALKEYLMEGR
jgi:dTDP-4-dehydrorhamnose reductase